MRNVVVRLSTSELLVANMVGGMRRVASFQNGNNKNIHAEISDWATDTDGAGSEMAYAKYCNVYWAPTVNTFKEPDVGAHHVRSTGYQTGHLIIRPNDKPADRPDQIFILVVSAPPNYTLVGSLRAHRALDFWREDKNSWWVPQIMLDDLPLPA